MNRQRGQLKALLCLCAQAHSRCCRALSGQAFETQCLLFPLCCSGTHMVQGSESGLSGEFQAGGCLWRPSRLRCRWFSLGLLGGAQWPTSTHEPHPAPRPLYPHPTCSQKLQFWGSEVKHSGFLWVGLTAASHCRVLWSLTHCGGRFEG